MMIDLSKNKLRQTRMELMDARMESKASLEEAECLTEMVNLRKEETRQNAAKIQVTSRTTLPAASNILIPCRSSYRQWC